MPGLYGSLVGAVVVIALVIVGIWLTWISLQSDQHRPGNLPNQEPDETE